VIAAEETEQQEGRWRRSQTSQVQSTEERKGRIALRREQCGVFTPCKNFNIETRSRDYAIVHEALFSLCLAESRSYKHLDDSRVGAGSRDRVSSDATIKAFSRMSDQELYEFAVGVLESSRWETTVEGT
jgi:hypothetical protein